MRQRNDPQGGTYPGGRQATGVAVGQQSTVGLHQRTARLSDAVAQLFIFFDQTQGFRFQRLRIILPGQRLLHAIQIIHQVDRRRPRRAQRLQRLLECIPVQAALGQQGQQQAGGQANQRRAAHPQGMNMVHQQRNVIRRQPAFFLRQGLLVENKKLIFTHPQAGGL